MELIKIDEATAKTFDVVLTDIRAKVEEAKALTLAPGDTEGYDILNKARMAFVHTRTGIDKRRKELNADQQKSIKDRNAAAKDLTAIIAPGEDHVSGLLKTEDDRLEAIEEDKRVAQKALIDERVKQMIAVNGPAAYLEIAAMTDEDFDTALFDATDDFKHLQEQAEKEEAERVAETDRLATQKAAQDEKAALYHSLDVQREWFDENIMDESNTVEDLERFHLVLTDKIESEEHTPELRALLDSQAKQAPGIIALRKQAAQIAADQKRIDDEKDRLEKIETDKKAAQEALRQAEIDAYAEADRMSQEEKEARERDAADSERVERLAPDKAKLIEYIVDLVEHAKLTTCGPLDTEEGRQLLNEMPGRLDALRDDIGDRIYAL